MSQQLEGILVCAKVEKVDIFQWTDPATNQVKPIRSLKVLLAHGDGTVTRELISIPNAMASPDLREGETYALPCTLGVNRKHQRVSFTLRADLPPFPAPQMG